MRCPWIPTITQILILFHFLFVILTRILIDLLIDPLIHLSFALAAPLCLHSEMS